MKYIYALALTTLLAALAIYNIQPTQVQPQQPLILIDYLNYQTQCTKELQLQCAVDVQRTVVNCAKAIQTQGASVIADIKCVKDILKDKKHCWPCICAEAKKKHWHIIGC